MWKCTYTNSYVVLHCSLSLSLLLLFSYREPIVQCLDEVAQETEAAGCPAPADDVRNALGICDEVQGRPDYQTQHTSLCMTLRVPGESCTVRCPDQGSHAQ